MPFLRAQENPHVERTNKSKKPKMAVRSLEDFVVAQVAKYWIYLDDLSTKREAALLGL